MRSEKSILAEQSMLDMCALVVSLTGGQHLESPYASIFRPRFQFPSFYGRVTLHDVAPEDAGAFHLHRDAERRRAEGMARPPCRPRQGRRARVRDGRRGMRRPAFRWNATKGTMR